MLRVLVIALLAVNLVLLGWRMLAPGSEADPGAQSGRETKLVRKQDGLPTISLLSEQASTGSDRGRVRRVARSCESLGPFESREALADIESRLQRSAKSLTARETETEVQIGYWVYLPPEDDPRELYVNDSVLSAGGVEDYALITSGPDRNAISFGLYDSLDSAQARKDVLERMGLPFIFEIGPRLASRPRFWLDYELRPGQGEAIDSVVAELGGIERHPLACERLAESVTAAEPVLDLSLDTREGPPED